MNAASNESKVILDARTLHQIEPLILAFMSTFSSPAVMQIANDMEPLLRPNRDTYLSGPHTPTLQAAALAYFDQHWAALQSSAGCGAAVFGDAGGNAGG
jgi:hypothetical protein